MILRKEERVVAEGVVIVLVFSGRERERWWWGLVAVVYEKET